MTFTGKIAVLALAICFNAGATLADQETATPKERYAEAMAYRSDDPTRMINLLELLANEGYARALDRLAYFTSKGIGTDQDDEKAVAYYRQAVAAGRPASLVSLGKMYLKVGAYDDAIDTLTEASQNGQVRAAAVLAWAHATERLGPLSEPNNGFEALQAAAQSDDIDAQMYLLDAASRTKRTPSNMDYVVGRLHERHADGHSKAAESLLRFYRMHGHSRGTLQVRADLLETEGLRDKIRVEEGLYLAAAREPGVFWTRSEELVETAPSDVYARALSVTARINRNAYVRILQQELRNHGYDVGHPSPYMNRPLIRAINRFCRDTGLTDQCLLGPLKSTTIKAVAGTLAEMRGA